jgi:U6 snRNA-associated Sm-like protein LSm5
MATRILPLELIDKAIGSQIWILLRGTKEMVGTLRGFDDYVSAALFVSRVFLFLRHILAYNSH